MSIMNRAMVCSVAVVVALSLAACGNQSANTTSANPVPQSPATASAMPALFNLKITSWGPESTKAGVVFNKQPNGSAALWIRVNHSLSGDEVAVEFNGVLLQAIVSGDLVTTGVPVDLYAKPGTYKVHVITRRGKQTTKSNEVTFTVD